MTAEVVIGNGFGVVVAADKATTSAATRTYEGAVKVVGLPQPHAIAVLHAGSVLFHGIPSSTLVENWMQNLPPQRLNRVQDYVDSFLAFIQEDVESFSNDLEMGRIFLSDWNRRLSDIWHWLKDRKELSPEGVKEYFKNRVGEWGDITPSEKDWARSLYRLLGESAPNNVLEEDCRTTNCQVFTHSSIEGYLKYWFEDETDEEGFQYVSEWARCFLGKYHPSSSRNIITFVGYGEKESLPALDSHDLEGVINGRLFHRTYRHRRAQWSEAGYALFETFGQDREIRRFVREAGLDLNYSAQIIEERLAGREKVKSEMALAPEITTENTDPATEDVVSNSYNEIADELKSGIDHMADKNEWETIQSFAGLNLENCASIAARFIHLTNLAFDIRGELPTVSSEVTIGIVTKAHGFKFVNSTTWQPE